MTPMADDIEDDLRDRGTHDPATVQRIAEQMEDSEVEIHISTKLHNVPGMLRDIASEIARKGFHWSKANGSGTSYDWECRRRPQ